MNPKSQRLVDDVLQMMKSDLPVKGAHYTINIEDLRFNPPKSSGGYQDELEMKYKREGMKAGSIVGRVVIKDSKGNEVYSSPSNRREIVKVPIATDRGTYLVNGSEKHILSQMRLNPGGYTTKNKQNGTIKTRIKFDSLSGKRAPDIDMVYDPRTKAFNVIVLCIGKNAVTFNGVEFLRILGFSDAEIKSAVGDEDLAKELFEKAASGRQNKTIRDLYAAVSGDNAKKTFDQAEAGLEDFWKENGTFGTGAELFKNEFKTDKPHFSKEAARVAAQKTFSVFAGEREEDDVTDLRYKSVSDDNDFILEKIKIDWERFLRNANKVAERESGRGGSKPNLSDIYTLGNIGKTLQSSFVGDNLVQDPEETNPLFIASMNSKITQLGQGGISDAAKRGQAASRNTATGSMNRIDPIETPESGNIGFIEHLSQGAKVEDKTIKSPVFKVSNKKANMKKGNEIYLSPSEEYNAKVAFFDTKYVKANNGVISFLKSTVPARYKNEITELPVGEIQYIDTKPQNLMGFAANMIPFMQHNDGNRNLMGSNMQKQSITLTRESREKPLVTTLMDKETGKTYDEFLGDAVGKPIKSPCNGKVTSIKDGMIRIKASDGTLHKINYYDYYPLNQSFINNDLIVKVGDTVTKGQIIAEGWQTKDGALALGTNTRVAYLPFNGYNYEDGIVVSRSYAEKMTSEHMEEQVVKIKEGYIGGVGSGAKDRLHEYTNSPEINRLDRDGIIKVGEYVKPGDTIAATLRPLQSNKKEDDRSTDLLLAASPGTLYAYNPIKIASSSYQEGEVKRVVKLPGEGGDSQKVVITLVKKDRLKVGDKVSGRHGNKGTITKILDDDEMPEAEDGKPIDLLFSPLAVPSRKNVGQLFEVNAGLVAEKTGKPFVVENFNHTEKDRVMKELDKIGYKDGKMKVTVKERQADGTVKEIPIESPVTVGNMYVMKLKHRINDKVQSRSNLETPVKQKSFMPSKSVGSTEGERSNPQRLGEMEMWSLQSRGAVHNMLESSTIKADGGGDARQRAAIFDAIATGKLDGLDTPATPGSLHLLSDNLKALGLNVKPINDKGKVTTFDDAYESLAIDPIKSSDFIKMVGKDKEVTDAGEFNAADTWGTASKAKNPEIGKADAARPGSIMDPKIFGEDGSPEERKNWGFVKLNVPIPNPIFMEDKSNNPYAALTGKKTTEVASLAHGETVVIKDPSTSKIPIAADRQARIREDMKKLGYKDGDIVDVKEVNDKVKYGEYDLHWEVGGIALKNMLKSVDVKKARKEAEKELRNATSLPDIKKSYNKVKMIKNLEDKKMKPEDLMMDVVPVAPKYLRPVMMDKKTGVYIKDDLNEIYKGIVTTNNMSKGKYNPRGFDPIDPEAGSSFLDPLDAALDSKMIYDSVATLSGYSTKKNTRTKKELASIADNLSGKTGLLRNNLLGKSVDFSGRSVIGVDPNLKLNEVGIPMDMARNLYKPFAIKEMIDSGVVADVSGAYKKINVMDDDAKKAIRKAAKDRPVIMNRQPSLHMFSLQAFNPIIKETEDGEIVRSIHMNPLVTEGFNADFDGDQASIHVPVTEAAKSEAKKLMMPSENLINPTDGRMIVVIRHEMALGIYFMTKSWNKPKGKVKNYTSYGSLRKDYFDAVIDTDQKVSFNGVVSTAGAHLFNNLLPAEYRDYKKAWNKKAIEQMFTQMYADAEKNDFKTRSKQDISNMIDDVKDLGFKASTRSGVSIGTMDFKPVDDLDDIIKKEMPKGTGHDELSKTLSGYKRVEGAIEDRMKNHWLGEDNPLDMMLSSGARGNPGQLRRMVGTVGIGRDVNESFIAPIKESHFDGLAPQQFFIHSKDSRKGIYDRAVSTSEPGALTRDIYNATQDVTVKEDDCGTRDGVIVKAGGKDCVGRISVKDVVGKDKKFIVRKGELIDKACATILAQDDTVETVEVRSPLKCKTPNGICSKCYGAMPGTIQLAKPGTAVGVIASQAMGEPVTQMTMNTFHGGGTASGATLGMPRVKDILTLNADGINPATLATVSGTVTDIKKGIMNDTVYVEGIAHKVPKQNRRGFELIKVKVGDRVKKGDFLTYGDSDDMSKGLSDGIMFTNADPRELFELKSDELGSEKAMDEVTSYLSDTMDHAFTQTIGGGSIDKRHIDVIVGKMGSTVVVMDPGDSHYMRGQEVNKNDLIRWNELNVSESNAKEYSISNRERIVDSQAAKDYKDPSGIDILKKGELIDSLKYNDLKAAGIKKIKVLPKPVLFESQLLSNLQTPKAGHGNWLTNAGSSHVRQNIAAGAALGQVDNLDTPRGSLMAGKLQPIGSGFGASSKDKNKATSMRNFFETAKKKGRSLFGFR